MGNTNTFTIIDEPANCSISPTYGFIGANFTITGDNLQDAATVTFVNAFEQETPATFQKVGSGASTVLQGQIPQLDGTVGIYQVIVANGVGSDQICCFDPWVPSQTNIPHLSGDVTAQATDRLAINSIIDNSPNRDQGFPILSINYTPIGGDHQLLIQAEVCMQSSFWGSAVLALFKDDEYTPRKVWNYGLMGYNMGQVARLSMVSPAQNNAQQTWSVRVGRTPNTYPIIYINRDSNTPYPYSATPSSWMSITEIEI